MLEIDATILVTFFLIWILVVVLSKVFWKPVVKTMDDRDRRLSDDRKAALAGLDAVARGSLEAERAIKAARVEADRLRSEIEADALKEKASLIAAAGVASKEETDRARATLAAEVVRLKEDLRARTADLAARIEKKLLDEI